MDTQPDDEMIEMIEIWLRQPDGSYSHEIMRMSDWLKEHPDNPGYDDIQPHEGQV